MASLTPKQQQLFNLFKSIGSGSTQRLQGYHNSLPQYHPSNGPTAKYFFGFEAEKVDAEIYSIAALSAYNCQARQMEYYRIESDSSLGSDGFELISPIYNLHDNDLHEHLNHPILDVLIEADTDRRCGGHMTISASSTCADDFEEGISAVSPFIMALYHGRLSNNYCRFGTYAEISNGARNLAVRERSANCYEFRVFNGIRNKKALKWRIKLLQLLFPRDGHYTYDTLLNSLTDITSELYSHLHQVYPEIEIHKKLMMYKMMYAAFHEQTIPNETYESYRQLSGFNEVHHHITRAVALSAPVVPTTNNTANTEPSTTDETVEEHTTINFQPWNVPGAAIPSYL